MKRRDFLKCVAGTSLAPLGAGCQRTWAKDQPDRKRRRPNVLFVFADQWRAQATGYAGDPNAVTPVLDRLEKESVNFTNAVSGCPVCSPYRASLLTGQYPLTHGVFLNDVHLSDDALSIAEVYSNAGYDTAYIGKWHVDGNGRNAFIPKNRRQGFEHWQVLECTHNYNKSHYYADADNLLTWQGYDAAAQTRACVDYIRSRPADRPFAMFMSWGPPHAPYQTAPKHYRDRFEASNIKLRDNVPEKSAANARQALAGYYAHIAALDDCMARILDVLRETGIEQNTILVFTSDHGDMLYSHGQTKKQRPFDESVRVPLLIRYPDAHGKNGKAVDTPINTPDIMPTLLALSGLDIPDSVEGDDFSPLVTAKHPLDNRAALLSCPAPFGQWTRAMGGREYRGVRTKRHTYVRDLKGPWLLFDNLADPFQLKNLCNDPAHANIQDELEKLLEEKLAATGDRFLPAGDYIKKWGWTVDETGTVPYWLKKRTSPPPTT